VFGEKSFAYFFYKILNPLSTNSFLMDDDFQKNVEKIIIRTIKDDFNFEILNPLYKRMSDTNNTEFVEIYSLILLNFLNYLQIVDMKKVSLKGDKKDDIYIHLICKVFNQYISDAKDDLLGFEFTIPEFFNKDKFKINSELIDNKLTKSYLKEDPKLEYIFKIILGSFSKKKKKPIGVFTDRTLILFNNIVDDIDMKIDNYLKKSHEIQLAQTGLLDFSDFYEIKYDVDSQGDVYPDVYSEFEEPGGEKKKKDVEPVDKDWTGKN